MNDRSGIIHPGSRRVEGEDKVIYNSWSAS
jgi:hypothetical protein